VTTYTVDILVVWLWLTTLLHIPQKSQCTNVPLTLQVLTDAIKHSDISGTSELLIICIVHLHSCTLYTYIDSFFV